MLPSPIAGDPVSHSVDARQLFGVDVQQLARSFALVPHRRLQRLLSQARQAATAEQPSNRCWAMPNDRGDSSARQPLFFSQLNDLFFHAGGCGSHPVRSRRPIQKFRLSLLSIPPHPFSTPTSPRTHRLRRPRHPPPPPQPPPGSARSTRPPT